VGESYGLPQMPTPTKPPPPIDSERAYEPARRSFRVLLSVPVLIEGTRQDGSIFKEETHTLFVNKHGALLVMAEPVETGQEVELANQRTHAKLAFRVVYIGPIHGGKRQVGVEFLKPEPSFWLVKSPPRSRNTS
jgi:PilZ domain-containing protein